MKLLQRLLGRSLTVRRLARWYRARSGGHPDWNRILEASEWSAAKREVGGPRILIATSVGGFLPGAILESLLAVALTLRKAEVHLLLCDEVLPACLESQVRWHGDPARVDRDGLTRRLCGSCFEPADRMLRALGLPVHRYGEHLAPDEIREASDLSSNLPMDEIGSFRHEGIAVGEHALAGALRFFARGTLDGEPRAEYVLREYLKASLLTAFSVRRLLGKVKFDAAVFHHGIYVPQGIVGELARREKVRVVNWNAAYRKKCFIFSHGDTYHHTLMTEPAASWERAPWTESMESRILDYLKSRWQGTQDWIWFHNRPKEDLPSIAREIGADFSKPCIGLLTNVMWDAQLHYPANAFPNMLTWMIRTLEYFAKRPDLQLIVRVHPAEISGTIPSRQAMIPEIRKAFPRLPPNVFLVPPESRISTYVAMQQCDSVIIFGTKTGVELSSMGIPVIVAGEAWIRNKGVTIDAASEADYFAILDRLPLKRRMSEEQTRRARQYAYHFFFRRMIPVEPVEPVRGWPLYRIPDSAFESLKPGRSPGLDAICRGILEGSEFVHSPP